LCLVSIITTLSLARIIAFAVLVPLLVVAGEPAAKRKVRVTHYGYPGDPNVNRNTRLGLGDRNNILNKDSLAVSPDLNDVFPFGSVVYVNGAMLGLRHDTTNPKWRNTIAIYDPTGAFKGDFEAYIDVPAKKK
jgi:3D (Asp-Asp-Asp) domain-containing protein